MRTGRSEKNSVVGAMPFSVSVRPPLPTSTPDAFCTNSSWAMVARAACTSTASADGVAAKPMAAAEAAIISCTKVRFIGESPSDRSVELHCTICCSSFCDSAWYCASVIRPWVCSDFSFFSLATAAACSGVVVGLACCAAAASAADRAAAA